MWVFMKPLCWYYWYSIYIKWGKLLKWFENRISWCSFPNLWWTGSTKEIEQNVRIQVACCCWVYPCSWTIFIFYDSLNSDFWIWFNFGNFLWPIFSVGVGFKNYFEVYSYSWTTFIFYSSFNSYFWFSPNFGLGVGFKS